MAQIGVTAVQCQACKYDTNLLNCIEPAANTTANHTYSWQNSLYSHKHFMHVILSMSADADRSKV